MLITYTICEGIETCTWGSQNKGGSIVILSAASVKDKTNNATVSKKINFNVYIGLLETQILAYSSF